MVRQCYDETPTLGEIGIEADIAEMAFRNPYAQRQPQTRSFMGTYDCMLPVNRFKNSLALRLINPDANVGNNDPANVWQQFGFNPDFGRYTRKTKI